MSVAIAGEEVRRGASQSRRFVYGGVSFDVPAQDRASSSDCHFPEGAPSFASVVCDVRGTPTTVDRSQVDPITKQVIATWSDDAAVVEGRGVRARMRRVGERRFVAAVERQTDLSRYPVEEALSYALVEHCGGVVLHAAAISLDAQGTVLFIGPSGAGKTTACSLTGRPFFAQDKLALVPRDDGEWWAWPLTGGSMPEQAVIASEPALPVAAICRVRRAHPETRVTELSAHRAVFVVRESCFASTSSGEDAERLGAIAELCATVPVLELDTVLGSNPLPVLREWLS